MDFENMTDKEFLEHYGVQGMKWGQRRATNKANVAALRSKGLSRRQAKNTNRAQNRVDAQRVVATGNKRAQSGKKISVGQRYVNRLISNQSLSLGTMARHPLSTKKAAALQLKKNATLQDQINHGQKQLSNKIMLKVGGVSIKDLDFSTS